MRSPRAADIAHAPREPLERLDDLSVFAVPILGELLFMLSMQHGSPTAA